MSAGLALVVLGVVGAWAQQVGVEPSSLQPEASALDLDETSLTLRVSALEQDYLLEHLVLETTPDGFVVGSEERGQLDTKALARLWRDAGTIRALNEHAADMRAASWVQAVVGVALVGGAVGTWWNAAWKLPSLEPYQVDRGDYRDREDYLYAREQGRLAWRAKVAGLSQSRRMFIEDRAWLGVYLAASGTIVISLSPALSREAQDRILHPHLHYSRAEAERRVREYNEALLGRLIEDDPALAGSLVLTPTAEPSGAPSDPSIDKPVLIPVAAPLLPLLQGSETSEAW